MFDDTGTFQVPKMGATVPYQAHYSHINWTFFLWGSINPPLLIVHFMGFSLLNHPAIGTHDELEPPRAKPICGEAKLCRVQATLKVRDEMIKAKNQVRDPEPLGMRPA